jgi:hypothetical protein
MPLPHATNLLMLHRSGLTSDPGGAAVCSRRPSTVLLAVSQPAHTAEHDMTTADWLHSGTMMPRAKQHCTSLQHQSRFVWAELQRQLQVGILLHVTCSGLAIV